MHVNVFLEIPFLPNLRSNPKTHHNFKKQSPYDFQRITAEGALRETCWYEVCSLMGTAVYSSVSIVIKVSDAVILSIFR